MTGTGRTVRRAEPDRMTDSRAQVAEPEYREQWMIRTADRISMRMQEVFTTAILSCREVLESASDGSVPRVIVTGFSTDPAEVKAGSDFKLTVHLKNTSKKTAVSNMLFDFQAPASGTDAAAEAPAFLPTSGPVRYTWRKSPPEEQRISQSS